MISLNSSSAAVISKTAQRKPVDPSQRRMTYGPIRPMDEDRTWLARLFAR